MEKQYLVGLMILMFSVSLAAQTEPRRPPRIIEFSGYRWWAKRALRPTTPGYNYFGADTHNVWIDHKGQLHLKIAYRDQRWYCAELISKKNFGYGEYLFLIDADLEALDPHVVFGLFTWDTEPGFNHREIDIEFSKWGQHIPQRLQYVVQPYHAADNLKQYALNLEGAYSTHGFLWQKDGVLFRSWHGHIANPKTDQPLIARWHYTGNNTPPEGHEKVRINLYLYQGIAPTDSNAVEVIIKQFIFIPAEE